MVNYLALLGWGPPDGVEIRPLAEIVELFRLEDVNPSPAFFDVKKLDHINGDYIRALPAEEFLARAEPFLDRARASPPGACAALARRAADPGADARRGRARWSTSSGSTSRWSTRPRGRRPCKDERAARDARRHHRRGGRPCALGRRAAEGGDGARPRWPPGYVNAEGGPQLAKAQAPVRVALTGRTVGPPLFESVVVLGRERDPRPAAGGEGHGWRDRGEAARA